MNPETVLDANRPEGTPLHDSFEWNDLIAAEKYRLNQAGHFIRCIAVLPEKKEGEAKKAPIRAFFTVSHNMYEPLQAIISEQDKRQKLLETALRDADVFMQKYKQLSELSPIFDAICAVNEICLNDT